MFAEFGAPEISILVVIAIAVFGGVRDSLKTKRKFEGDYTELKTKVDLKIVEFEKDLSEMRIDLKEHIERERQDRREIYKRFDDLHQKIADDNENINQTITETYDKINARLDKFIIKK